MLKIALTIAGIALAGLLAAPQAKADHDYRQVYTYRSGHASCGCPTYTQRHFRGYDRCDRPYFGYYRVPLGHLRSCRHNPHYRPPHHAYYRNSGPIISVRIGNAPHVHPRVYQRGYSRGYSRGRGCR